MNLMKPKTKTGTNGLELPYRIFVPKGDKMKKPYSLLLFLHGAGERGSDNQTHINIHNGLMKRIMNDDILKNECIIIAPQCPEGMQWVDAPWSNGSYSFDNISISKPMQVVEEILSDVRGKYDIDENRIYISGISMGGFGAWYMLMRHPDCFAAAVPICGGADPSKAADIKHIPIRTYHNADDSTVPVSGTREMVSALKLAGGDVLYTEHPFGEHNSWEAAFDEPDILEWIFAKHK